MTDTKTEAYRMVEAHKQGVKAYCHWIEWSLDTIREDANGRFSTPAEREAYIAGYCGAKRRAEQEGIE